LSLQGGRHGPAIPSDVTSVHHITLRVADLERVTGAEEGPTRAEHDGHHVHHDLVDQIQSSAAS
jgi:hypothetical protein